MASKENHSANKSTAVAGAEKWLTDVKTQYSLEQEWLDNGLVTMGDTSRISAVIRKLMRGESVTVVGLGGSITEGYFSGEGSEQSRRVADFLNAAFPEQVTFVNAGISATGAVSAAHRLQADVLSANPDLVILEYAVNDNSRDAVAMAAYENVVRNLLSKDVAILALHNVTYSDSRMTATGSGKNHENIGTVYSLPQVSAVDAFFGTSIYAKGSDTTQYYYGTAEKPDDGTHPNEKGHAASGALMANLILNIMKNIETQPTESEVMLTAPMYPDGNYINVDTATIVKAETINAGDARVTVSGVEYTALEAALGQGGSDIRANNTYNGYYAVTAGTTATFTLNNVTDAFFIMLQSAAGSETGVFTATAADGTVLSTGTLDSYYIGALTEESARIINSDDRIYHGDAATVTVTVTVPEGENPAYIGGVMGCFN